MKTRAEFISDLVQMTNGAASEDFYRLVEATAVCLVTQLIVLRGQPYSFEVVETISNRVLEFIDQEIR
jgi:hypothetical protein